MPALIFSYQFVVRATWCNISITEFQMLSTAKDYEGDLWWLDVLHSARRSMICLNCLAK